MDSKKGFILSSGYRLKTTHNPYHLSVSEFVSNYSQYMTSKVSTENVSPHKIIGDDLNFEFVYNYEKEIQKYKDNEDWEGLSTYIQSMAKKEGDY